MNKKILFIDSKNELKHNGEKISVGTFKIGKETNLESGVVGTEEALNYFTEKFNSEMRSLNCFEQACYMQILVILEKELMNEWEVRDLGISK